MVRAPEANCNTVEAFLDLWTGKSSRGCQFRHSDCTAPPFLNDGAPIECLSYDGIPQFWLMRLEELFRSLPDMQLAGRSDLQPVVINRKPNGATP